MLTQFIPNIYMYKVYIVQAVMTEHNLIQLNIPIPVILHKRSLHFIYVLEYCPLNICLELRKHSIQNRGWWKSILPSLQPVTSSDWEGENFDVRTTFRCVINVVTSYSSTGLWGTQSHSSLHMGSNDNSLTPKPNGEHSSLPSLLNAISLM